MAIRNVNGRNVYVIIPDSPTAGTKTTTGKNWATLYTNLRWQVWEATQKNEATMLKLELASADQRRDYYDDKIKILQDQRKQLQSAALKAERGNTGSANSDALRAAQGLERMARATAGKTVTTSGKVNVFDEPIPPTIRITAPSGGVDPKAKEIYETIAADFLAGEATETEVKEAAADAGVAPTTAAAPSLDSQIERLDKELESLLTQRRGAGTGVDFDLQARTRRSFEADQGVIGQGGTAFGLAPRRRRTRARVDQPLAQERVAAFAEDAVRDKAQREALQESKIALLSRREEAMALQVTGEPDMATEDFITSIDKQLDTIDSALAQPSVIESALQSQEFTPRGAGELLLKDRFSRQPERAPRYTVSTGEMEAEEVPASPVEPSGGMGELGIEPKSPEERAALEEAVRAAGVSQEPKPVGELPPAPVADARAPITDRKVFVDGLGERTPSPPSRAIELGKDDAITDPDILDNPDYVPSQDLLAEAKEYYKDFTIKTGNEKPRKIRRPVKYFGGETEMVKEFLKQQIRDASPVGQELNQEAIEAVDEGEPQAKTTRQRKDLYRIRVVTEGARLAKTPKKLERLAKTNSEVEDRPQHFVIVDKLMATNSGKSNAFNMSYDEISRAYKDNPDQRKEAHSYLVAKDILESDITEPLA